MDRQQLFVKYVIVNHLRSDPDYIKSVKTRLQADLFQQVARYISQFPGKRFQIVYGEKEMDRPNFTKDKMDLEITQAVSIKD